MKLRTETLVLRLMLISVLLSIALVASAEETPSWYWRSFVPPRHSDIVRAVEGKIVVNARVYLADGATLVASCKETRYQSDAVQKDVERLILVSRDGGASWIRSSAMPPSLPHLDAEERAIDAVRLSDGTFLNAGVYSWVNHKDSPEKRAELADSGVYAFTPEEGNAPGNISTSNRAWTARSIDDGKTWKTTDIEVGRHVAHLGGYVGPILSLKGTCLLPVWGRFDLKDEPKYVSSLLLRSEDSGRSWTLHTIAKAEQGSSGQDFNETSITQAPDGTLVALIRTTRQQTLWTSISTDDGKTWSPAQDSGLRGSTPFVVTASTGVVVGIYVRRNVELNSPWSESGICAAVSRDNGRTWDAEHQVLLRSAGKAWIDGYPYAVALPDGSVYVVYGFEGAAMLGGTRFSPEDEAFGGPDVAPARKTESQPNGTSGSDDTAFQLNRQRRLSQP